MFADNPILSRTLAILLLAVVVASVWILLIAPVIDKRAAYKAEIEGAKRLIIAFEKRRENIGLLEREISALRNDRTSQAAYFTARNATLAAAKLQSKIKTLTQASGATLTSSQVLTADDDKSELQRIIVRVHMVGTIEAVRSIFHTLESGKPNVFLDNVTVSANASRRTLRRQVNEQDTTGLLTVRYEAYGFLWLKKQT